MTRLNGTLCLLLITGCAEINPFGPRAESEFRRDARNGDSLASSVMSRRTAGTVCDMLGILTIVGSGVAGGAGSLMSSQGRDPTPQLMAGGALDLVAIIFFTVGILERQSARSARAAWKERWDERRTRQIAAEAVESSPHSGGGSDPRPAWTPGAAPGGSEDGGKDGEPQPGGGSGTRAQTSPRG